MSVHSDVQRSDTTQTFDPSQPSIPISYPIKTLKELDSRSYFSSFHYPFNKSSVPLRPNSESAQRPKILVCHDMKGGYLDDKWVQGGDNPDAYAIWHWFLMDVFVYFSHNLVTLPPPCWTNAAHRHGVKVLGTFITENWKDGYIICKEMLSTKESAHKYAERLAELAVALGFDGWLLNIESNIDVEQIPTLKEFISHLTQTMHSSVPGSLVIWYDSVTISGFVYYQNQLNEQNKPFFDICDGIFTNYGWQENYPEQSGKVAGNRKFDVYMGIDVFGRGTYGDGGWNTNVALDVIVKSDVSAAIFAPGWVHETNQPPDFQTAQNRWWGLVEKSMGNVVKKYPSELPFYSNFDQGQGYQISVDGVQVSSTQWNNISSQTFQPFVEYADDSTSKTIDVLVDVTEASFGGGGNLTFGGTLKDNAMFSTRLFSGQLHMGSLPVHFTYSVKSKRNSQLGLSLTFSSETEGGKKLLIASGETSRFSAEFSDVIVPHRLTKLDDAPGWAVEQSTFAMNGFTLTEIHAVCYSTDQPPVEYLAVLGHIKISTSNTPTVFPPSTSWIVDGQDIKWGDSQGSKTVIHAVCYTTDQSLKISTTNTPTVFPPSTSWILDGQDIKWGDSKGSKTVSLKISWKLKDGKNPPYQTYNIYVKKQSIRAPGTQIEGEVEYMGVAHVEAFYVSQLSIPSGTSSLKFMIQVCDVDGSSQKLEDVPYFQLNV